jgi:hypothetical protein
MKSLCILSAVFLCLAQSAVAASLAQVSANGTTQAGIPGLVLDGATGMSLAGATTFFAPMEGFQVNGAAPNAQELPVLRALAVSAKSVANKGPIARRAAVDAFTKKLVADTAEKKGKNPAFTDIAKGAMIMADSGLLQDNNAVETARAETNQTLDKAGKKYNVGQTNITAVNQQKAKAPFAVAYTGNRDPMAVIWDSSLREITYSFDGTYFELMTSGPGSAAAAVFDSSLAVIDGTVDVTTPESAALLAYSLTISMFSFDGASPFLDPVLVGGAGSIRDSFGITGPLLPASIAANLKLVGNRFSFTPGYQLIVTLPGKAPQSVLFFHDSMLAEAAAVPEPASATMVGLALGAAALFIRSRLLSRARLRS